ncbi:hypothetical protein F5884DRAFT_407327 [Xylogone sp. PMI_703]|nr:hypothetical protein F5884DRAFT_407327 [Xylogone sp. PMI_703]
MIDLVAEKVAYTQTPFYPSEERLNPYATELVALTLQHDVLFHAALCLSSIYLNRSYLRNDFPVETAKHRGEVIRLLISGFQGRDGGIDDASIAAATLLSISDLSVTGDVALNYTHVSGINKMVSLRGGLGKLGMSGMLRIMVLWSDECYSLHAQSPPSYSKLAFKESGLGIQEPNSSIDVILPLPFIIIRGGGFRYCMQQGLLRKDVTSILEQLSSMIAPYKPTTPSSSFPSGNDAYSLQDQALNLISQLDLAIVNGHPCSLERAILKVVKLYITGIEYLRTGSCCSDVELMTDDVRVSLVQASLSFKWCSNLGLFLWVFFSACLLDQGSRFRKWLKDECNTVIWRLQFAGTRLEDITSVLSCFLWSSALFENSARKLWEEIIGCAALS